METLALAAAATQAGHLGVDVSLVHKHQAVRLLAHADLTLICPDTALIPNVGACALRGHLGFFIREAVPTQQSRKGGGSSHYPVLLQSSREFGHGDVRLGLGGFGSETSRKAKAFSVRVDGPAAPAWAIRTSSGAAEA
jgi:hypothetical protein